VFPITGTLVLTIKMCNNSVNRSLKEKLQNRFSHGHGKS